MVMEPLKVFKCMQKKALNKDLSEKKILLIDHNNNDNNNNGNRKNITKMLNG